MNLEGKGYKRKDRYQLCKEGSSDLICRIKSVLKEQYKFYSELYASDFEFIENKFNCFTDKPERPQLMDEDKIRLEEEFSLEEVKNSMFKLKCEKVLGSDGIPIEFYQNFFTELKYILWDVCRIAAKEGLHTSAKQGIIALIEKSEKTLAI